MPGGRTQYYNVARNVAVGKLVFYRSKSRTTRRYAKLFRCERLGPCNPTRPPCPPPLPPSSFTPFRVFASPGSGRS